MKKIILTLFALSSFIAYAQQTIPADSTLGESVVFVKGESFFDVDLETTVFKPEGAGPFPVVVLNHGKEGGGNNRFQARNRPLPAVREFLKRGYVLVAPMRQGFSRSGGTVVGDTCNLAANGDAQAKDVTRVVQWLKAQNWADTNRMVMMGQSHGGLTTLAYAKNPDPGFKVFANFAGGLKFTSGCDWEKSMKDAYSSYGEKTKVESVWFYGENDSFFPPTAIGPAHAAYVAAGGKAAMVAYGAFGSDAHGMFASYDGLPIWWDKVQAKLESHQLPTKILHPQYALAPKMERPASTKFSRLEDDTKVPFIPEARRTTYKDYLTKTLPRAFAIAPNGSLGWANGGYDPLRRALESCNRRGLGQCKLYSVDNDVVWLEEIKY